MIDQAFEALNTFDWGNDLAALQPIHDSVIATREDPAARRELESKLAGVLKSDAPRAAKDYACRQLRAIGSADSVATLAALLPDPELSHMARYALESIPDAAAGEALRDELPRAKGGARIGIISSLGARGEEASVRPLALMLSDSDESLANAAARALAAIGTVDAVKALAQAKLTPAIEDALLRCAETLRAGGDGKMSQKTYQFILANKPSAPARQAAERGLAGQ